MDLNTAVVLISGATIILSETLMLGLRLVDAKRISHAETMFRLATGGLVEMTERLRDEVDRAEAARHAS